MEELVKVLFKAFKHLLSEAARVSDVEPDLRDLGHTVERIHARLRDAEQQRLIEDYSVLKWLRDLKDLVFDYEDIDEEFKARLALSKSGASRKRKRSWFPFSFSAPLPYHYWTISKKIAEIWKRYEKIYRDRTHLRLEEREARPAVATRTPPPLMAGSIQDETLIHGRQNDVERIVNLLTVDGGDGLPVICIHGAGGMGKSALARSILQDCGVEAYFALRIWVNVSVGSDVMGITTDIIQSVTGKECDLARGLDPLQRHLRQLLDGKTFLVVLDGVKDLDIESWEKLRAPLVTAKKEAIEVGETGGSEVRIKASKILVTTQNGNVSRNMKAEQDQQVTLEGLPEDDCWAVFRDHAFGGAEAASGPLEMIGRDIARKCHGSPLAAKLVGSHLYNVGPSESEWTDVRSNMPDLGDAVRIILPTLKLSYDRLPLHLKHCFAFCSIFPNGHEFDKDELVKLWMAVGFVEHTRGRRLERIAADYFDQLARRSFFQASHNSQQRDRQKYRIPSLIHEVAQYVSNFECLRVDHEGVPHEEAKGARYALVRQRFMGSVTLERIYENEGLRTFILHGEDGPPVRQIPSKLFQRLKYLRVLDFSHSQLEELPDSLGDLILLRYLSLYSTQIKSLPESVGNLHNLQTLELGECHCFDKLPDSVGDLEHLRYLGLYRTKLINLPDSLGKLSNLQKLELGGCQELLGLPDSVGDLRQLRYLGLRPTRIERLPESLISPSNSNLEIVCDDSVRARYMSN